MSSREAVVPAAHSPSPFPQLQELVELHYQPQGKFSINMSIMGLCSLRERVSHEGSQPGTEGYPRTVIFALGFQGLWLCKAPSYSWECHMKGELSGSAQHGAMPLPPPLGPGTAPAPVPAQSEQGSSTAAGQTAGEGRGRRDHTALISMQRWDDFCRAGLDLVPIHGLQTLSDGASSLDGAAWMEQLWGRECYRPVLPTCLLTLFSSLGKTLTMDCSSAPRTALCVTAGPAAAAPASWCGQSPLSAPRVSLWNDRPAKKIESPFL